MNSDSESQDSDDGRRFRFESTRKDTASLTLSRRKVSPQHRRRRSRSRSRSRSRNRSSRYSKDADRRSRSSVDRETNSKKEKSERSSKSSSKEKKKHHKDSHRSKESDKHKSKHKKRSRDRSREKNNSSEERPKVKEEKPEPPVETNDRKSEKRKDDESKRKDDVVTESNDRVQKDSDKVNEKSTEKTMEEYNALVISDEMRADAAAPSRKRPKSFFERIVNKKAIEEDTSYYGPALPPQLEKKLLNLRERKDMEQEKIVAKPLLKEEDESQVIGPTLPPHLLALSQKNNEDEMKENGVPKEENKEVVEDDDEGSFGPALPPNLQKRKIVGPVLPENFVPGEIPTDIPLLSPKPENKEDEDDDDNIVGPLPADHPAAQSQVQLQLEYRALQMQARFRDKTSPEKNKREEWMTELPPAHAVALGLGSIPRTFRTTEGPDMSDRSMWTDTPADRLRKQKEKEENRFIPSQESSKKATKSKDKEGASKKDADEKRPESLLDMHLKNLKKKKKKMEKEAKELGLSTRRPFDRDVDLQANRLDEARKKKIFEKAGRLNDRFSTGKML